MPRAQQNNRLRSDKTSNDRQTCCVSAVAVGFSRELLSLVRPESRRNQGRFWGTPRIYFRKMGFFLRWHSTSLKKGSSIDLQGHYPRSRPHKMKMRYGNSFERLKTTDTARMLKSTDEIVFMRRFRTVVGQLHVCYQCAAHLSVDTDACLILIKISWLASFFMKSRYFYL